MKKFFTLLSMVMLSMTALAGTDNQPNILNEASKTGAWMQMSQRQRLWSLAIGIRSLVLTELLKPLQETTALRAKMLIVEVIVR